MEEFYISLVLNVSYILLYSFLNNLNKSYIFSSTIVIPTVQ